MHIFTERLAHARRALGITATVAAMVGWSLLAPPDTLGAQAPTLSGLPPIVIGHRGPLTELAPCG